MVTSDPDKSNELSVLDRDDKSVFPKGMTVQLEYFDRSLEYLDNP